MNEAEIIRDAYKTTVAKLWMNFFDAYTMAQGDAAREQQAETNLRNAILHARHVRDRALAVLP